MGIPTVLICTDAFVPLAKAEAKALGIPDMRIVTIPHPLGGLFEDGVRERAHGAIPAIMAALGLK